MSKYSVLAISSLLVVLLLGACTAPLGPNADGSPDYSIARRLGLGELPKSKIDGYQYIEGEIGPGVLPPMEDPI